MRILITADLHYDILRSRGPTEDLARRVLATGGDALVLLGDSAGRDLQTFRRCLRLFEGFAGRKLLVPGNHCIWAAGEGSDESMQRYEHTLPQLAGEEGFTVLDHQVQVMGPLGLAGSIGWYDYSFRQEDLGVPLEFYRAKVAPGAAERMDEHAELWARCGGAVSRRSREIFTRWMDGQYVRLGISDEEFVSRLVEKLSSQLEELSRSVGRIAVFLHHLPFRELVPRDRPDGYAFAAAYMGSERLGELLRRFPKARHVYCGHSHWPARHEIHGMEVINVGSTYTHKMLEVLEVEE